MAVSLGLFSISVPQSIDAASKLKKSKWTTKLNSFSSVNEKDIILTSQQKKDKILAHFYSKAPKIYKKNQLLIKFKNSISKEQLKSYIKNKGIKNYKKINTNLYLLQFNSNLSMPQALNQYNQDPKIEYAEPNYQVKHTSSDPYFTQLWGLKNTGQTIQGVKGSSGKDIAVEKAWAKSKGSSSTIVAVSDTGIQTSHPDIKYNIWKNSSETLDGKDNDGNGYVDDTEGWDFYWGDRTLYDTNDDEYHGTHVAGTIAAKGDNSVGVIGVAPNVKIMPLKFLGPYAGYDSDAILAINYAKNKGAKIMNCSWGSYGYSQSLYDTIKAASNMLIIAAAGNDSTNTDSYPHYPSAYSLSNILAVAAVNNLGNLASFSNYGVNSVDVAAPGQDIISSIPTDMGSYSYLSGTSMAAPHVSGAAALVYSLNPSITPTSAKTKIMQSVKKLSSLNGKVLSGGLLNAGSVVSSPDDEIPGTALPSSSVKNSLSTASDRDDVFYVNLKKSEKISLSLTGASGTDFDLYLYGPSATSVETANGIVAYSEKTGSSESIVYTAPASGKYYIDIYAYSGSGSYTLSVKQGIPAGTYEEKSSNIDYTGTWTSVSTSSASANAYRFSNTTGSKATIVFNGKAIILKGLKAPSQGIAKIILDGTASEISMYSKTTLYKTTLYSKSGLASKRHVLEIHYTGKAASGAKKGATRVNIDTITIQ